LVVLFGWHYLHPTCRVPISGRTDILDAQKSCEDAKFWHAWMPHTEWSGITGHQKPVILASGLIIHTYVAHVATLDVQSEPEADF